MLPLHGIKVVEIAENIAGPYAGQILALLGAEVLKIERPEGDNGRGWGPPFHGGMATTFHACNMNKQSVVLDLKNPADLAWVQSRIAASDVVVQNMRPGQADSLGLGGEALTAAKPGLIYCNIGAFGARGPLAARPGYDPLMQAFGGLMSVTGEEGRPPVRVAPSIIDVGTGLWAVIGILAALHRRPQAGRGGVVDVSLFETAVAWMSMHAAQYQASGQLPGRQGSGQRGIVPYRAFRTADGDLVVAAGNNSLFTRLAGALGHPEWAADPRFASNPLRVEHQAALYALIEPEMAARPSAAWVAALDVAGVPCAPVQDLEQMLGHEQTAALGMMQKLPGLDFSTVALPISFDGARPQPRLPVPGLGQHTAMLQEVP